MTRAIQSANQIKCPIFMTFLSIDGHTSADIRRISIETCSSIPRDNIKRKLEINVTCCHKQKLSIDERLSLLSTAYLFNIIRRQHCHYVLDIPEVVIKLSFSKTPRSSPPFTPRGLQPVWSVFNLMSQPARRICNSASIWKPLLRWIIFCKFTRHIAPPREHDGPCPAAYFDWQRFISKTIQKNQSNMVKLKILSTSLVIPLGPYRN